MNHKIIYSTFSFFLCLILSTRTIPSEFAPNDLGRYFSFLNDFCQYREYKDISHLIFIILNYPSCALEWEWLFIFTTSLFIPISLIPYVKNNSSLVISMTLLLSVAALEHMTNALRQGISFLFISFALFNQKSLLKSKILFFAGVISHHSSFFYTPLLLKSIKKPSMVLVAFLLVILTSIILINPLIYSKVSDLIQKYSNIYEEKPNISFFTFMLFGFFIPIIPFITNTKDLKKLLGNNIFITSFSIILFSIFIFPYITYRFIMFSTLLNYLTLYSNFNIVTSINTNKLFILATLTLIHTTTMLIMSNTFLTELFI